MGNPNIKDVGVKITKETAAEMGAKGGHAKKGSKHLSTWIQELLVDPEFELKLKDGSLLNEVPIKAIIKTAVAKSISGDSRWAEWLAKHGYGNLLRIEMEDPRNDILNKYGLGEKDAGEAKKTSSGSSKDSA